MATDCYIHTELTHSMRLDSLGVDLVFDMIQEADIDCRPDYYKHIVLSGGSSMYPGLPSRLEKEITDRYTKDILKGDKERLKKFKLNIEDPPRRKHMVFLGGSVLADVEALFNPSLIDCEGKGMGGERAKRASFEEDSSSMNNAKWLQIATSTLN